MVGRNPELDQEIVEHREQDIDFAARCCSARGSGDTARTGGWVAGRIVRWVYINLQALAEKMQLEGGSDLSDTA